ncbi:CHASE domain-containing protein [Mitsuaria sp. CC2]|jgi:PAS domain S-box-containing protein|uniref:CHASE domain-containing protein n=1 Tax=Mitsuaria sp. CC2 TaxID=3029186 RepID=UPI003B8C62A5
MTDASSPAPSAGTATGAAVRSALLNVALALAYLALGVLSLKLILPPDFVSPIYPAAGLAVAAALRWGPGVLPGIAIGGAAVSLTIGLDRSHVQPLQPVLVGLGGAAQAWLGAWLARRWTGDHPPLCEPAELVRFLVATAGIACLVGPSVGVAALWITGAIGPAQVIPHWLAWWVGDAIGVLIGAPVSLALFGLPRKHWAPRRLSVALPMLIACALLFGATLHVARNEEGRRRHAFDLEAVNALNTLSDTLSMPLTALEANHSLLLVAPNISRVDFERAHAERARAGGAVYAVGWAPLVRPQDLPAFEKAAQADGYVGYRVYERRRPGDLTPNPAEDRLPIRLIAPFARNRPAMGANVRNIPQARAAQERAMATGQPAASESFPLSQDAGVTLMGVVVYRALYEGGSTDLRDAAGRARRPTGVAFATLRPETLLHDALAARKGRLDYCLIDVTAGSRRPLLAGDERCLRLPAALPSRSRDFDFAGRAWRLVVYNPSGLPMLDGGAALPFAIAGLAGTALLGLLLLSVTGSTARVARRVEEATHRLRASEERFRDIVEHAPIGVVTCDLNARPQEINPYFCQLLGMSLEQLKARSILAITHPEDRAEDSRLGMALIRGELGRYSRVKRYIGGQGQVITVRSTVSLLRDAQGQPSRLLGVVEDIGEQLRLAELERIHEAELAANRAKNEFLSRMSHELRTPLNAMLGFSQLLESDPESALSARQRGWLAQIQQSGWHLLAMINDTLDLSRLDAGGLRVQIDDQDLAPIVSDSLAMIETQRQRRGVAVDVELAPDAGRLRADATRLKQVLTNLLSNAVKYNHEGGRVRLRARRINDSQVELSVSDTGPGLTEGQMGQLFQPFNRLGREVGAIEGTGIGLVITQRLLALMGSRLRVASIAGEGATFSFDLPISSVDQ